MDLAVAEFFRALTLKHSFLKPLTVFLAEYVLYIIAILALIFIWKRYSEKKQRIFTFAKIILGAVVSRGILAELLKFFYPRPRPFTVLNFSPAVENLTSSFPSGHAALAFTIAFLVFFQDFRRGTFLLGLAVLNGIGRIALGLHWFSDILGGTVFALLVSFAIETLFPKSSVLNKKTA